MKHIITTVLILCVSLGLVGCGSEETYRLPGNGQEKITNQVKKLIQAIEDKDVDAILDMFAQEALEGIDDKDKLKEDIETLIATFPNWDGSYDSMDIREYKYHSYRASNYMYYFPDIEFTADGNGYQLHLVMVYETQDKDLLGLYVIQVCDDDCSDYKTKGFSRRPGQTTKPGVYCWDYDAES